MTKIYVNLYTTTNTAPSPWTNNAYGSGSVGVGVLTADLLDDTSSSTGVGLEVTNAFTGAAGSTGIATADNVWPKEVFDVAWYTDGTDGTLRLTGLTNGDSYTVELAGHTSNSSRDTNFTVGATTTLYDSAGTGVPNAPISFSGTVSGTTLDLTAELVSVFGYANGFTVELTGAAGPTLTGPASTTEGSATVAAGTDLDTVTTFSLISGTFSIAQTIDSATATTLNYVAESGANDCVPATPVLGVPLEATISAAGVTPYQIQQEADDGTNPAATFNTTLNGEATHEVVQTMIAVANTTPGESIFGTDLIAVEDDMQAYVVKAANGMNITWAADGTFTTDADQTEIIDVAYFAPSTGQWSCLSLTIKDTSIVSGGILRNVLRSPLKDILRNPIK